MSLTLSMAISENSANVANNTSNVTVNLIATWNYGTRDTANTAVATLVIDGNTYTQQANLNPGGSSTGSQTLFSKAVDIAHSADGSKQLYCSGSYKYFSGSRTVSTSAVKTLTTIARASSPTASVSSPVLGTAFTIATNRVSSGFTHTLNMSWNGQTDSITGVKDSVSWTPPISWAASGSTGTLAVECITYNGASLVGSKTIYLTMTRPGASSLSSSENSIEVDGSNSVTLTVTPNSPAYTDTVTYAFGTLTGQTDGLTDLTFTPPVSLLNQIPNSAVGSCIVTTTTKYGDTTIGTNTCSIALRVPASVKPTATIGDISDTTNYSALYGYPVIGLSVIKVPITGSGIYSSTISAYAAAEGGQSVSGTSSPLTFSGTLRSSTISAYVTDSRGKASDTVSKTITALPYSNPAIGSVSVSRGSYSDGTFSPANNGTRVQVQVAYAVSPLNSRNSKTISVAWTNNTDSTDTGSVSVTPTDYSGTASIVLTPTFPATSSYTVTVTLKDDISSAVLPTQINTADAIMDFKADGKGLAIGKMAEVQGLDVAWDSLFTGTETHTGNVTYTGDETHSGSVILANSNVYQLSNGTALASDADMDSLTTAGNYYYTGTDFPSATYPMSAISGRPFTLRVEYVGGILSQKIEAAHSDGSGTFEFRRYYVNGAWGDWRSPFDAFYPVGSLFISENPTSPASLFGGTWEQLTDGFIATAGFSYQEWTYECAENESFTLSETTECRFGVDGSYIYKTLSAGTYTAVLTTFGTSDPAYGTVKHVDVYKTITIAAGDTGGEASHALTISELAKHTHLPDQWLVVTTANGTYTSGAATQTSSGVYTSLHDARNKNLQNANNGASEPTGESQPHNNMPPYVGAYVWKRVS